MGFGVWVGGQGGGSQGGRLSSAKPPAVPPGDRQERGGLNFLTGLNVATLSEEGGEGAAGV